jgi:hypothetical protein
VLRTGKKRNTCKILLRKPEVKRSLGNNSYGWKYEIIVNAVKVGRKVAER